MVMPLQAVNRFAPIQPQMAQQYQQMIQQQMQMAKPQMFQQKPMMSPQMGLGGMAGMNIGTAPQRYPNFARPQPGGGYGPAAIPGRMPYGQSMSSLVPGRYGP